MNSEPHPPAAAAVPAAPPAFPMEEYSGAIAEERMVRDYAFLGLPTSICGIDVVQMTLRHLLTRSAIGCPFITNAAVIPDDSDIASFIWHLSVARQVARHSALDEFHARQKFYAVLVAIPYWERLEGIDKYLADIFLDAPPTKEGGRSRPPISSAAAVVIDIFAAEYHWSPDQVLDLPLPRLYQQLREINVRNNPKAIVFNRRSEKIQARHAQALTAWRQRAVASNSSEDVVAAAVTGDRIEASTQEQDSSRRESGDVGQAERL